MPTRTKREVLLEAVSWCVEEGRVPLSLEKELMEHDVSIKQVEEIVNECTADGEP